MKKTISFLLLITVCLALFAGCAKPKADYIMTVGQKEYPVEPFRFITQYRRDIYYQNYVYSNGSGSGWSDYMLKEVSTDGTLFWEYVLSESKDVYLEYIFIEEKFEELGLSFTEAEQKEIDETFKAMTDDYVSSYGEQILTDIYEKLNITEQQFKEFTTEYSYKASKISAYYFGDSGEYAITDAKMKANYNENYRRFKYCIFPKTDSDGNTLKVAELAAKEAKAKEALAKAQDGKTSFEDIIKEYSEAYTKTTEDMTDSAKAEAETQNSTMLEIGIICNSEGVYDSAYYQKYGSVVDSEIVKAVFAMENGDCQLIETNSTFWVIKACDINETEELFNLKKEDIFNAISTPIFDNLVSTWKNNLGAVFNETIYNKYDPRNLDSVFLDSDKLDEAMKEYNSSAN